MKFGFGRATRDASRMIQNGHLTRAEGVAHARAYDHEFPSERFDAVLEYLGCTQQEFDAIIDQHRNTEIWTQEHGEWKLRFPPV